MIITGLSTEGYGLCIGFPTGECVRRGGYVLTFRESISINNNGNRFSNCEHMFSSLMQPINLAEKNDLHPHGCWDVLTSEGLGGSLLERKKENSHIQVQHKDFCNSTMVLLKSLTLLLVSDWHCCYDDFMNNVFTVFLFNLCFVPCMQIGQMSPVHACFWVSIFSTLWWALRLCNYLCTARCSALNHSAFLTVQENSHDQPFHTSLKLYQMQRSCPYDNWSHLFVFSGIW